MRIRRFSGVGDFVGGAFALPQNPVAVGLAGLRGLGQTTTGTTGVLSSLQTQVVSIWNDLQATKIAGIGLGVIIIGGVVAMHFMKRR